MRRAGFVLVVVALLTLGAKPDDPRAQRDAKSHGNGPPSHAIARGHDREPAPSPAPPPAPRPDPEPGPVVPPGHPDPPQPVPVDPPVVVLPDTAAER